jgi:hypothetical protein
MRSQWSKAERRAWHEAMKARRAARVAADARDAPEALRRMADASDGTIGLWELIRRLRPLMWYPVGEGQELCVCFKERVARGLALLNERERMRFFLCTGGLTAWRRRPRPRSVLAGHSMLYRHSGGALEMVCHREGEVVTVVMVRRMDRRMAYLSDAPWEIEARPDS